MRQIPRVDTALDPRPPSCRAIVRKPGLDSAPQLLVHDCFVLARIRGALMNDLAPIDAVLEEMVERPAAERAPAEFSAGGQYALLVPNPTLVEVCPQFRDAAQGKVLLEDQADAVRLLLVDHELAVLDLVTERNGAAHPHALAPRGRELVADALAREFPLELGEGGQDVEPPVALPG